MTHGPLSQADFLTRMGLQLRVQALTRATTGEDRKEVIESAAKRLVDPAGMGNQYKFLAVTGARHAKLTPEQSWPFVDNIPQSTPN